MDRKKKAIEYFRGNYSCSQSVLLAYSDLVGIDEDKAKAIASGFGGGIAQTKKTCGALTGAIMLIGLEKFNDNNISNSKELTYRIAQEVLEKFKRKNKSTDCIDLVNNESHKNTIMDERGKILYKECEKYISDVCEILDEYLIKNK
ncbi:MAG: C_GCAxxG_C_C family protein [Candidatus Lokiarchaeota archaeon]|nr:C_GCAxxG_C_C family protein [Candidatus Lokiarchaeota archaeon]